MKLRFQATQGAQPPAVSDQSVPQQESEPECDIPITHHSDAEGPVVSDQPLPHQGTRLDHDTLISDATNLPQFHEDHPVLVTLDETTPPGPPHPPLRVPDYCRSEENIPHHPAYRVPVDPALLHRQISLWISTNHSAQILCRLL